MTLCKILFFATLKDLAEVSQITLEIPDGLTVKELKAILRERFPPLERALNHALVAVNREYATETEPIPANAEIALFPPVSGGSTSVHYRICLHFLLIA